MKKQVNVAIDNLRRSVNTNDDLPSVAARWGVQEFGGAPADGSSTPGITGSGLPTTDGGGGSGQSADCTPPAPAIPLIDDPRAQDDIGRGREVFERLAVSGSSYVPSLRVDFYRAVWFDGLEAYNPVHYGVGTGKVVTPIATLSSDVQVSARYVVR